MSLLVNNRVLVKSMYTSAALGRNLTNYVAFLLVKFGQPFSKQLTINLGCVFLQSLRCCATNRKVAVSIPDGVGIFH